MGEFGFGFFGGDFEDGPDSFYSKDSGLSSGSSCTESTTSKSGDSSTGSEDSQADATSVASTLTYDSVYENFMATYGTTENI